MSNPNNAAPNTAAKKEAKKANKVGFMQLKAVL